jgi:predicted metalloprotease
MNSRIARRRRRRLRRRVGAAVFAALLLGGAATILSTSAGARSTGSIATTATTATTAIEDIQSFWAHTMPNVYGRSYEPIADDHLYPYSSDDPPPACGERGTTPYEQVAGNAFYCSEGDFVAWDVEQLVPKLTQRFGDFAVALVLAHEWGHVIQARTSSTISATIYLENQADCFAGAWAHHVESGDSTRMSSDESDLDTALGGYLEFRDPPGIDPSQDGAHGNGFDRVSAFQDGFEAGADQCATYENDPPPVTESQYTSYEDQANGGDVALADAVDLVHADLDDYWNQHLDAGSPVKQLAATTTTTCDGPTGGGVLVDGVEYCAADQRVTYDPDVLARVYDSTGDFGAGMVLAAEWSAGAQDALGFPIDGRAGRLLADCLTGTWAGDVARGTRSGDERGSGGSQLSLSPGDLDQGIATFVGLGGHRDERGSAFARVAAFRKGFFKGIDACTDRAS